MFIYLGTLVSSYVCGQKVVSTYFDPNMGPQAPLCWHLSTITYITVISALEAVFATSWPRAVVSLYIPHMISLYLAFGNKHSQVSEAHSTIYEKCPFYNKVLNWQDTPRYGVKVINLWWRTNKTNKYLCVNLENKYTPPAALEPMCCPAERLGALWEIIF